MFFSNQFQKFQKHVIYDDAKMASKMKFGDHGIGLTEYCIRSTITK